MKATTFRSFLRGATELLDALFRSEIAGNFRRRKATARLTPAPDGSLPSWKRPGLRLRIDGLSLSEEIIRDRRGAER